MLLQSCGSFAKLDIFPLLDFFSNYYLLFTPASGAPTFFLGRLFLRFVHVWQQEVATQFHPQSSSSSVDVRKFGSQENDGYADLERAGERCCLVECISWLVSGGTDSDGIPDSDDIVVFNGTSVRSSVMDGNFAVAQLQMTAAYSGQLNLGSNALSISGGLTAATTTQLQAGSSTVRFVARRRLTRLPH